jgi:hypothetical protein
VQKAQLYHNGKQEKGQKTGDQEILQVVQGVCIAQGIQVV